MATVAELLVKIGADPSQFEKAVKRTEKSLNKMGKKLTDMGDKMTKGLTLPLAAAGLAAGSFADSTDTATGKIQAQLGTTAEEAEKLGDIAEEVWKNAFGTNLDEVATSLTTVKRNMKGVADTDLQGLTESAFVLRDAFDADINQSTKTAGTLMKNFGVDGQKAFDLMTVGFQKGGDFSGELLDTLNEYAPQFADIGMSAEDAMNLLISGAQNGAFNLDKVGDAVKEFNVRATDGSKTTAEGFAALGLDAELFAQKIAEGGPAAEGSFQTTLAAIASIKDPLEQDRAGVALFGTQWEDLSGKVVTAMSSTVDQLGQVDGATQKAGDALYDNFGTRLTDTWRNAQSALEPLGNTLLNLADEWLPKISTAIENAVSWFTNLSPKTQDLIVKIGLITAAIGPLLLGLGFMTTAIAGTLIPMGGAIIKATALAIKWAFLGTESTRSAVKVVASWVSTAAAAVANTAVMIAQSAVMVAKWVWMGVQSMAQAARMAVAWIIAMGPVGWVIATIVGLVALIIIYWDEIKAATITAWNATMQFLSDTWEKIKSALSVAWEAIKQFFIDYWPLILGIFTGGLGLIVGLLIQNWDSIRATINKVWTGIKEFLSTTWTGLKNTVSSVFGSIATTLKGIWNGVTGTVNSVWDGIVSKIKGAINSIISSINKFINGINRIQISVPSVEIPGVGKVGGFSIGLPNIPNIPQLATGTNNVPQDMFAMLHEGEAVVPKKYNNNQGDVFKITINANDEVGGRAAARGFTEEMTRRGWRPQGVL